jgi:pseudouridine-5'-phosphate glycosidase
LLDIPKTLEYLETRGVPVIGYRTSDFPAFWSRSSGLPVPLRLDSLAEIARVLELKWSLGLEGGALIANPIDSEHEIPAAEMSGYIEKAVGEAAARGVSGKAVTPFILAHLKEITNGRSLVANIALVKSNAQVGAALAASCAA